MRLRICSYRWLEEQLSAPRLTVSMMSWTPSTCHPPAKWVAKWLDWSNRSKRSTNLQVTQIHSGPNRWKFPEVPMSKDCVYMPKQTPTFRPCLTPTICLLLVPPECATVLCEQLLTWVVLRMANVCPEWMLHDYSIIFTHAHGRCAAGEQKQETIINHLLPWFSVQLSLQKKRCPQIANKPLAGAHLPGGHSRVYSAVMSSDLCTIGAFDIFWLVVDDSQFRHWCPRTL